MYEEIKTFTDKFDDHGTDDGCWNASAFAKPDVLSDTGIESEAGIVMDADFKGGFYGQTSAVQKGAAAISRNIDGARSH